VTVERRDLLVGLGLALAALLIYWVSNRAFDAGRGDFFYLADAFLHGRTWLEFRPGPFDVIEIDGRFYVPFAPFPAVALMPIVGLLGAAPADRLESGINAGLAAFDVWLCWILVGRLGVQRLVDRLGVTMLFAFSTVIWWVTTRGGVWHTGHLIATALTFGCLIELWGRQRAGLVGLLGGFAFLTRAPLAFALPFYLLMLEPRRALRGPLVDGGYLQTALVRWPIGAWIQLCLGVLPSIVFFFWYNLARFGDPLESGYALAALPPFLEAQRQIGMFSLSHVGMNVDYFLFHLPRRIEDPPFFRPDGLGLSILVTSPGLLLAGLAPWRSSRSLLLLGAAVAVLVPTLLYYGGGWLQYGYRYFLDSIPLVVALCGLALARRPGIGLGWVALIAFGALVNGLGVYWAYRI
jgi:hypothetical protein